LTSIDALRGAVMVIMTLDHTRDFFHAGAMSFSATDLAKTTTVLFLTRWITHFCLPVFMFAAGMGAFLYGRRKTKSQLAKFLWTRGVWFVLLELTLMQWIYTFSFSRQSLILLLILWIFGICMLAMAALVHLPLNALAVFSVAAILIHNCLDNIQAAQLGSYGWLWNLLHQPGIVSLAGRPILISYTFLPWIAVMAAGYCCGRLFTFEPEVRRRILIRGGVWMTAGFVLLRAANLYGDPSRWAWQSSLGFTVLSFLNCTKYPASLDFLLMTLGPALLCLAYLDNQNPKANNPLVILGRVPMFYFVLHFLAIHILALVAAWVRYGNAAWTFMFGPLPSMGGSLQAFPPGFGYSLPTVYAVWVFVLLLLYPICRRFAQLKATRQSWWLSYL
jgi:uncharacterized membrane protein